MLSLRTRNYAHFEIFWLSWTLYSAIFDKIWRFLFKNLSKRRHALIWQKLSWNKNIIKFTRPIKMSSRLIFDKKDNCLPIPKKTILNHAHTTITKNYSKLCKENTCDNTAWSTRYLVLNSFPIEQKSILLECQLWFRILKWSFILNGLIWYIQLRVGQKQ